MELSKQTGSPCQDVFQFTISGHRRRTVNKPSIFREGADLTDVSVTSSVQTSNECQSSFDRTNSVETNDICSLQNFKQLAVLVVVYSSISPAFV